MSQYQEFSIPKLNKGTISIIVTVILIILVIIFSSSIFVTIQSGHAGIIFRPFSDGLDKENVYPQGFHIIAPWNKMIIYNVQKQEKEEKMDVLSSNGLSIIIDVSVRYFPEYNKIGHLHDEIGINYLEKIILPEIRAAARKVVGRYTPEELYSSKRDTIQMAIESRTSEVLKKNYIVTDALLIRSVRLPQNLMAAIERKLEEEQKSQEYEFRIEREAKEAERKKIEAQGIQDFQKIVTDGISEKLLRWKGIEATQDLAKSPNAKVVIVGSGKDGLPIILNAD
jgi:prohibitin 1